MTMPPTITVVAGDPGGAAALAPVLADLQMRDVQIKSFAYRQALVLWQNIGLTPEALPEDSAAIVPWLAETCLLLTATSVNGIDWEPRFWAEAKHRSVPSLAVLDYWSNLRSRFLLGDCLIVPSRIATMDDRAREGLMAAGIPGGNLCVTGQPAFDDLAGLITEGARINTKIRARHGITSDEILVLFASQPLSRLHQEKGFGDQGFNEKTALDMLLPSLASLAQERGVKIRLVIRPHPREDSLALSRYTSSIPNLRIDLIREGNAREWALAADLVSGMNSILLQEACYLERPVLSLQPGLIGEDSLPANSQRLSRLVTAPIDLLTALNELLFDPTIRAEYVQRQRLARPIVRATDRITELAWRMLKTSEPRIPQSILFPGEPPA